MGGSFGRTGLVSGSIEPTESPVSDTAFEQDVETEPPVAHARIVYLGPVAPHWEIQSDFGDSAFVDGYRSRVMARLVLLPPHDPQFRRNRERCIKDAERENIQLDWDLGYESD